MTALLYSPARLYTPSMLSTGRMFYRIFRADPLAVRAALIELRTRLDKNANPEMIGKLELALAEILNNICEHGGVNPQTAQQEQSPLIHLCVMRHVGGLACAVTDNGMPLPLACLTQDQMDDYLDSYLDEDSDDPMVSNLPEGGFGWFLIRDLTSSLSYFREGRRNLLAFTVPVETAISVSA